MRENEGERRIAWSSWQRIERNNNPSKEQWSVSRKRKLQLASHSFRSLSVAEGGRCAKKDRACCSLPAPVPNTEVPLANQPGAPRGQTPWELITLPPSRLSLISDDSLGHSFLSNLAHGCTGERRMSGRGASPVPCARHLSRRQEGAWEETA